MRPHMRKGGVKNRVRRDGLTVETMDMLSGNDKPAVRRELKVGRCRKIFVAGVQWDELAYLIMDLSPGPVDTQLTLAQNPAVVGHG